VRYSEEIKKFIAENVQGVPAKELINLVNTRFNTEFTTTKMQSFKKNHKLKSFLPGGVQKGSPTSVFPKNVQEFIRMNYPGTGPKEMTNLLNETFKTSYKTAQLKSYYANHKINSGTTSRFGKGHVPQNKGLKGVWYPGTEISWFKKGSKPVNHKPVGSERINADGYVEVKTAEPNKWRLKHRSVYEQHFGAIPAGFNVIFADKNPLNLDINNLILITKQQHLMLNRKKLRQNSPELTKSAILVSDLYIKISERRKRK
jgi:hypothetical protein